MATLAPAFLHQFLTNAGLPAAGYKLHAYESGTTTDKETFTAQDESGSNTNPITLDAAGRCILWLDDGEYTFTLKDPTDTVTVWTRDDVGGVAEATDGDYLLLAGGTMTGPIVLPGNASSALQAVPKQQLDSSIAALSAALTASLTSGIASATPIGSIALWLTSTAPTGWLHLNGQAVSRTTYDDLFTLWGTTFGSGDGSTTFNVPDVRGEFPRFWDASRGVDAGRAIGSAQAGAFEEHHHDIFASATTSENSDGWATDARGIPGDEGGAFAFRELSEAGDQLISDEGGTETRPRNFSFMAICKAL
jgi:phage-related tail fiber protein